MYAPRFYRIGRLARKTPFPGREPFQVVWYIKKQLRASKFARSAARPLAGTMDNPPETQAGF
jgi:hypothetical protein